MASLDDTPIWTDIYQLEQSDPVVGGAPNPATGAGMDNIPHLQLARRTSWLKQAVETLIAVTSAATGSVAGVVKLSTATNSAATDTAATSSAVKAVNDSADSRAFKSTLISAGGLATGGGDLTASRSITVPAATSVEAVAGTSNAVAMTPVRVAEAIRALPNDNAGPVAPASTLAGMLWRDTSTSPSTLRVRNDANTGWITNATDVGLHPGAVMGFAMQTPPTGWVKANGAIVSRTAYGALFAAIGTTYGNGDGATTFALPDYRGEFLRGWDDGRGIDTGRVFGSLQVDEIKSHTHAGTTVSAGAHKHTIPEGVGGSSADTSEGTGVDSSTSQTGSTSTSSAGAHTHTFTTDATGGTETRPRNRAVLFCIKY